jgi:hypothetical protein
MSETRTVTFTADDLEEIKHDVVGEFMEFLQDLKGLSLGPAPYNLRSQFFERDMGAFFRARLAGGGRRRNPLYAAFPVNCCKSTSLPLIESDLPRPGVSPSIP